MAKIGFIGVGNMGGPMARNLIKAGHGLKVFDLSEEAVNFLVQSGAERAASVQDAAKGVDYVVSMLPVGGNVKDVFMDDGVIGSADPGTVFIDSSTIDVESSVAVHEAAKVAGFEMIDAPVSGGTTGADAATLTFMCGGEKAIFDKARPILEGMGKNIVYCGGPGQGQVVKICNNMIAGSIMLVTSEAFALGEKLGVDRSVLQDVIATSSGSSWIVQHGCPMPGAVAGSPASNKFKPGFMAKLMLKDLRLAQAAAEMAASPTPIGAAAAAAFQQHVNNGHGDLDMSSICKLIDPEVK